MKNQFKNSEKIRLSRFVLLALAGVLSFSSCKKSDELSRSADGTGIASKSQSKLLGIIVFPFGDYTINFKDDVPGGFSTAIRDQMVNTFFAVYPKLSNRFNTNAAKTVTIWMNPDFTGVAQAGGTQIEINPAYMSSHPKDVDVVVHEGMHIVQAYKGGVPGWLTEGIADYVRYKYGIYNDENGWKMQPYRPDQSYTAGYGTTATFLVWLEQHYSATIVDQLNTISRNGQYTSATWVNITGKTVDQLWSEYGQNPTITGLDVTTGAVLTVSRENGSGAGSTEGSLKLIDNSADTKFFIDSFPSGLTLKLTLPQLKIVTSYRLTSGNDFPDRDPKSWTLHGSNDNSNWTQLDSQTNQVFTSRKQEKTYSFSNLTAYKYYRISVSANNGSAGFQLAEWRVIKRPL
ncbi:basic secretory protein-like protein [Pedobacter hartonius]|uniref:F5/8 type C domain-containing protein n=1 Tax=Pedobacter hartonius TaxID=425514 RepID=A0A1H4GKP6_9SPHI|nr:basic secretory protein-like protein [Pedobacter hartonius]SEB10209.1 F5/8 type C domain-containing protein [Pedobacter hartonius]